MTVQPGDQVRIVWQGTDQATGLEITRDVSGRVVSMGITPGLFYVEDKAGKMFAGLEEEIVAAYTPKEAQS